MGVVNGSENSVETCDITLAYATVISRDTVTLAIA